MPGRGPGGTGGAHAAGHVPAGGCWAPVLRLRAWGRPVCALWVGGWGAAGRGAAGRGATLAPPALCARHACPPHRATLPPPPTTPPTPTPNKHTHARTSSPPNSNRCLPARPAVAAARPSRHAPSARATGACAAASASACVCRRAWTRAAACACAARETRAVGERLPPTRPGCAGAVPPLPPPPPSADQLGGGGGAVQGRSARPTSGPADPWTTPSSRPPPPMAPQRRRERRPVRLHRRAAAQGAAAGGHHHPLWCAPALRGRGQWRSGPAGAVQVPYRCRVRAAPHPAAPPLTRRRRGDWVRGRDPGHHGQGDHGGWPGGPEDSGGHAGARAGGWVGGALLSTFRSMGGSPATAPKLAPRRTAPLRPRAHCSRAPRW